jgi:hypothetical protein
LASSLIHPLTIQLAKPWFVGCCGWPANKSVKLEKKGYWKARKKTIASEVRGNFLKKEVLVWCGVIFTKLCQQGQEINFFYRVDNKYLFL